MKKLIVFAFALIAFGANSQSVKISVSEDVDWSKYRTFKIAAGELVTVLKNEIDDEAVLAEIRKTIVAELESRGFTQVTEGDAQLLVDFTGEVTESTNVEDVGPLGKAPADEAIEMDQSETWSQTRRQGSLVIDMSDTSTRKSVWTSSVAIEFSSDELAVIFNAAVGRSMRKFQGSKK